MPATFKGGRKKQFHHSFGFVDGYEAGGDADDICVVVLAGERCKFIGPAEGCTDVLVLVGSHAYAIAAAAYQYAGSRFPFFNHRGYRVSKVGIVYTVETIGAFVRHLPAHTCQH